MQKKDTFYITTPIYYPSGQWHLGHCYTTVCCDAIARYKRMSGYDVFYLTGTDEHGQKIEKKAAEQGVSPKAFVDERVAVIKNLWRTLDISYDKFIRTTDEYHEKAAAKIFDELYKKGDIYKSVYKGKYCTPCESFWTENQLVDGKCPDCGREVTDAEEECYFFRLSAYRDRIIKLLTETDYLQPKTRVNEMVNNFLKDGLNDLAVSRTSFKWGIPVPFDDRHVIYVWVDALTNYITALGYGSDDDSLFKKYWPADLHMVGKEIVRFHAIVWPAILMALSLPLPKKVYGHGWLMLDGDKMSKSKGNVVDPLVLCDRYGVDAVRYYLLREIPFGSDANYSGEAFIARINQDLANDLGNLVKRTLTMNKKYFGGKLTAPQTPPAEDAEFIEAIDALKDKVDAYIEELNVTKALEAVFAVIGKANKYIDVNAPWVLDKEGKKERLMEVMYNLTEAIRVAATLLLPFMTKGPAAIFGALRLPVARSFDGVKWGAVKNYETGEADILYPRLDVQKELKEMETLSEQTGREENKNMQENTDKKPAAEQPGNYITIDDFCKVTLRVGEVIASERVEKSSKLLKNTVKIGDETRTILSGIAKYYTPEEMVGKRVVVVTNLKPRMMCGYESSGMILCAEKDGKVVLVSPEKAVESGAEVC
ncbi:MAG TPA: methionine--tRNA ligase [Firmicutes bacterium]|nr:methionine--tRNA ligase [Bacillota bacterium]